MKKKALGLIFILTLLITSVAGLLLESVRGNSIPITYLPVITISADGSITPQTSLIIRTGTNYTLTGDVEGYGIEIECSNIVLDGAGHNINTTSGDTPGLSLHNVNGITVKNLEFYGRYTTIYLYFSSNCLITDVKTNMRIHLTDGSNFNTITKSSAKILNVGGSNNVVTKNTVWHELFVSGLNNNFYRNNFLLEDLAGICYTNSWDDGLIGNYWGNYSVKYPNATEIGNTGIGNTSYIIEREHYTSKEYPNASNTDHYPLMYRYNIENDTIAFPTPEPHVSDVEPGTEPFSTALAAGVSAILIAGAVSGLVYYRKKHGR